MVFCASLKLQSLAWPSGLQRTADITNCACPLASYAGYGCVSTINRTRTTQLLVVATITSKPFHLGCVLSERHTQRWRVGASKCRLECDLLAKSLVVYVHVTTANGRCEYDMNPVFPLWESDSRSSCGLYDSRRHINDGFVSSGSDMAVGIAYDLQER